MASQSSLDSKSPRSRISWTTWKVLAYGYARETKTIGRLKSAISRYVPPTYRARIYIYRAFQHDPAIAYPRIYNDFFSECARLPHLVLINDLLAALKSRSHLLKLSIAHALAQSTLLAHYESSASQVLLNSSTMRIPKELASTGTLSLTRGDALRLTGRLFKLRTDVNLVSNVLDVPELFWSEASLKGLYDAVREYLEIGPRVGVLNERLSVANDLVRNCLFPTEEAHDLIMGSWILSMST